MSDKEFEILDALYFTVSFQVLTAEVEMEAEKLLEELLVLIEKGWVKCLEKTTEIEIEDLVLVKNNYKGYNYLASKKGLMAHNSR